MNKYIAEFIGTFILVMFGCASIALLTTMGLKAWESVLPVSLTFGLTLAAVVCAIGNISGGHVNPAVSLAVYLSGGLKGIEVLGYFAAQFLGGLAGAGALAFLIMQCDIGGVGTTGLGANGYGTGASALSLNIVGAVVFEIIGTFVFILATLRTYRDKQSSPANALAIGLSYAVCVAVGYLFTGGSFNPARSLAPALVLFAFGNTTPIQQVIVFVLAPFIASAIAAFAYAILTGTNQKVEIVKPELSKKEEPTPKQPAAKKSATKAKPTTPSRVEKAEDATKRKSSRFAANKTGKDATKKPEPRKKEEDKTNSRQKDSESSKVKTTSSK